MSATKAVKKSHYYFMTYRECVYCGRKDNSKERVYGKKPKNAKGCVFFDQYICTKHL